VDAPPAQLLFALAALVLPQGQVPELLLELAIAGQARLAEHAGRRRLRHRTSRLAAMLAVREAAGRGQEVHVGERALQRVGRGPELQLAQPGRVDEQRAAGQAQQLAPAGGVPAARVVLGSSGVGKSTLVNALVGSERQRTGAVREDDSRGRHTTTHRELVRLPGGALLIDTPGIRSLGVAGLSDGIDPTFADIADLALQCRFSDCRHDGEPGCAVQAALADGTLAADRLASHRKLEREAAHVARASDPLLRAEERRKWRAIHVSVNQHMKRKYGSDR